MHITIPNEALPSQVRGIEAVASTIAKYLEDRTLDETLHAINVVGGAGAGKSWTTINGLIPTVMGAIKGCQHFMDMHMPIYLTTTTHQANDVIQSELIEAGYADSIPVSTIHSHLRIKPWSGTCTSNPPLFQNCGFKMNDLPNSTRMVIFVDEAFRIDPDLWAVMRYLRPNCLWINTYDAYQTPPVGYNSSPIDDLEVDKVVLTESPRFTNAGELAKCIVAMRKCVSEQTLEYMDVFDSFKDVAYTVVPRKEYGNIIRNAVANKEPLPDDTLLVCGTRKATTQYNNFIHKLRKQDDQEILQPRDNILVEWVVGAQESPTIDILRKERRFLHEFVSTSVAKDSKLYPILGKYPYLYQAATKNTYIVPLFSADAKPPYKLYKECTRLGIILIGIRLNYARTVHTAQGMSVENVYMDLASIKQWANHDMRRRLIYTGGSRCSGTLKLVE